MKKTVISAIIIAISILLQALDYVPNEIIVKTKAHRAVRGKSLGLPQLDNFLSQKGVKKIKPVLPKRDNKYYVITLNSDISEAELSKKSFEGVEYVQPNYINQLFTVPNDPGYVHQQYYLIDAPRAWDYSKGNKDIIVGLVDSGIHLNHPDLIENIHVNQNEIPAQYENNLDLNNDNYISLSELISYFQDNNWDFNEDEQINAWDIIDKNSPFVDNIDDDENGYTDDILGWDFVDAPELSAIALGDYTDTDNNPEDENNHGTHVGGIIAANTNNNIGVAGTNWHAKLLVARAGFQTTASQGYLQDDDAAAAVIYAADNGANVINASWGDYVFSQIIADACQYAFDKGCVVCVASGNTGEEGVMYPAKLANTIAVGAADAEREVANLTSWGPELDLIAPGINIYSTLGDGVSSNLNMYDYQSGTSMAAPFVTGAVALLLSVQPNLDFEEIKAKLHQSSEDVGETGFDNHSGAGLLNLYNLIMDTNDPYIKIDYPQSFATLSHTFPIIGSVNIPEFSNYCVMFTNVETPNTIDWHNVTYPHANTPEYYTEPVNNDTIANFEVDETILDSLYKIKVEVRSKSNDVFSYFTTVKIDRSAPVILDSLTFLQERYQDETLKFFMKVATNEPSYIKVTLENQNNHYEAFSNITSSIQSILLPDMRDGRYSIRLEATNLAGLKTIKTLPYQYTINNNTIDINSYTQIILGDEKIFLNKTHDVDGNGKTDFVAVNPLDNINPENNILGFYEIENDQLTTKRVFNYSIYPQDMGDTDGHGIEVVGKNITGPGYHYENNSNSTYPDRIFAIYDTLILGRNTSYYSGSFIDFNNDQLDDIAIKTSSPLYELFIRDHNEIIKVAKLYDSTPYDGQINSLSLRLKCGLLDRDNKSDIIAGDSDGDVMVFEYTDGDTLLLPVWAARLGFPNINNIALGKFKDNTFHLKQFCVGGYYKDFLDPANSYSYYLFFENNGSDNSYIPFGGIGFTNVNPPNDIAAADIDGDGYDELVVLVPPNVYIVKYNEALNKFEPIWNGMGANKNSNSLAVLPKTETEEAAILVNIMENGEMKSTLIRKAEPFTGPPTPANFRIIIPKNLHPELHWDFVEHIDYYAIYRKKIREAEFTLIDSVYNQTFYQDSQATIGDTLIYKITAHSTLYQPNESKPTHEKMIILDNSPHLDYIGMDSVNRLKVIFDKKLANTSFSVGNFFVNNSIGYPVSVNQIEDQHGVLLTFTNCFVDTQGNNMDRYNIRITDVKSSVGIPFYYYGNDDNIVSFDYSEDTTPPKIERIEVSSLNKFKIIFTESMQKDDVENMDNYRLTAPPADKGNRIISINYDTSNNFAEVTLSKKANRTNQVYFLRIDNIRDISNNKISESGNKISFFMNPIKDLKDTKIGPNPLYLSKEQLLKFYLPLDKKSHLKIFNLTGNLVFETDIEPLTEYMNFYPWDGRNMQGKKVSSGIYFYLIKMDNKLKKGKFTVIR